MEYIYYSSPPPPSRKKGTDHNYIVKHSLQMSYAPMYAMTSIILLTNILLTGFSVELSSNKLFHAPIEGCVELTRKIE